MYMYIHVCVCIIHNNNYIYVYALGTMYMYMYIVRTMFVTWSLKVQCSGSYTMYNVGPHALELHMVKGHSFLIRIQCLMYMYIYMYVVHAYYTFHIYMYMYMYIVHEYYT